MSSESETSQQSYNSHRLRVYLSPGRDRAHRGATDSRRSTPRATGKVACLKLDFLYTQANTTRLQAGEAARMGEKYSAAVAAIIAEAGLATSSWPATTHKHTHTCAHQRTPAASVCPDTRILVRRPCGIRWYVTFRGEPRPRRYAIICPARQAGVVERHRSIVMWKPSQGALIDSFQTNCRLHTHTVGRKVY